MHDDPRRAVLDCARQGARDGAAPLVLAVSGGVDSMALLHAIATVSRARIAAVATFDHGTGPAATAAVALVETAARDLGIPVQVGCLDPNASRAEGREAAWRTARYRFLRRVARELGARVATAHTRDDQVETILMRVMRGTGVRGLAAMSPRGEIARPFLALRRHQIARYAEACGVAWAEDPSNVSRAFFRNRIRLDLLPALRRVEPGIDDALLAFSARAAVWRGEVEALAERIARPARREDGALVVAAGELRDYDSSSLCVLWGALAGCAGLALDRRGTQRCAAFTMTATPGRSIPLSGGWHLEARKAELVLRRRTSRDLRDVALPGEGAVEWGDFRFSVSARTDPGSAWCAELPGSPPARVRSWQPGDRLSAVGTTGPRRVKRYLSDAGVVGWDRTGWPVVVVGDEVVWIPGVRRSNAATARSGRPGRSYVCERTIG